MDRPRCCSGVVLCAGVMVAWFAGCRLSSPPGDHLDATFAESSVPSAASDANADASDAQAPAPVAANAQPVTPDARHDAGGSTVDARVPAASPTTAAMMDLRCRADADEPQRTDYAQPGKFAVGTIELTFEDKSRPIAATDKHPAAAARTLLTTIYYPAADVAPLFESAPVAKGGPFPLLMYSHGYSSGREEATPVANHAASYGYIVVVPEFPLTNILANGGADILDAANQPGDLSFLIDQVLALSADATHAFANAVDATRIGALGVSLGGLTTLLVSFHPRFHDPRIQAVLPIAAWSSPFTLGFYHTRNLPMLLLHGDLDAFINYEFNGRRALERAAPNARLITVAKGSHAAFGAQLDPLAILALNAVLAPEADPSNPDGLGCGTVGDTLKMTGPEFLESLGGSADFIEPDPNPAAFLPCVGDENQHPALGSAEQEAIAVSSSVAFFDAHLAQSPEIRKDACHYLLYELPKNPAVTVE